MKDTKISILLIEDDEIDIMTAKRALDDNMMTNPLDVVNNGVEALAFLRDKNNRNPDIILLDLNMPKMNGIEFLRIVKEDDSLKKIPTVVLTTSTSEVDKSAAFNLGVAGYFLKPVSYKKFVDVVKIIDLYWTLNEFPE